MARGRKRKFNPAIPGHIDQDSLPKGVYWADQRWFVYDDHPEGGRRVKRTIAHAAARLSDLHAMVEERSSGVARGTLRFLFDRYHASSAFKELATGTRKNYLSYAEVLANYVRKDGTLLGAMQVNRITTPVVQRLVETFAAGRPASRTQPALPATPTKANHLHRYLRLTLSWGVRMGYCSTNPAKGVRQAKEQRRIRMPTLDAYRAVLAFARERGALPSNALGRVSDYLAPVMVLAYSVRLRGIEVCTLTDAHRQEEGIHSNRRKGSRDNITEWDDEMLQAWNDLVERRHRIWNRKGRVRPVPLRAIDRYLLVERGGNPIRKSALDTAWQRLITEAISAGVIDESERFSLHGLKHRGITDSDNKAAGGHRTEAMRQRYDHEVPLVKPPRKSGL
jgi:site-specific recombinase XerC